MRSRPAWVAIACTAIVGTLVPASGVAHTAPAARCLPSVVYSATAAGSADAAGTIRFADMTEAWGADVPLRGMRAHAVATGDANGDGWTDVFVGTFADRPLADYEVRGAVGPAPDRLLLGGRGGLRIADGFPGATGRTSGAAFVDLDGDGHLDLVVARNVRDGERAHAPSEVARNVGGGRFERATVLPAPVGARSVGLLDYDRDGRTDLFVVEDRWSGGSSVLLRNEGAFRFTDVTAEVGLPTDVAGLGVATADLSGDGAADLFVGGANRLFVGGPESGRFHEVTTTTFAWPTFGDEDDPAGVAAGDVDRDGRIDLVVGQHYGSTVDRGRRVPVRLYLNAGADDAGDPTFRDVTDAAGLVGLPTRAPHVEIADFDADGWLDVLAGAAGVDGAPVVFRSSGVVDGVPRFVASSPPGPREYWPSGALLDADHDGRLDVVLADFEPERPSRVLRNDTLSGHWLAVSAPPGSRVELRDPVEGSLLGVGVVNASSGFGGGAPPVIWFGVGGHDRVTVKVRRPTGTTFRAARARVDRMLTPPNCGGVDGSARRP